MQKLKSQPDGFPKISAPAQRALAGAKIKNISDLVKWKEKDLAALHGVGPKVMRILKFEMKKRKISFREY